MKEWQITVIRDYWKSILCQTPRSILEGRLIKRTIGEFLTRAIGLQLTLSLRSLNTTRARDKDQVVYRHTTPDLRSSLRGNRDISEARKHEEGVSQIGHNYTANIKEVSRLVMVDQLWMWILDSKTIITCFPKRYGANRHDTSGKRTVVFAKKATN
jgi:hypothetical protein